MIIGPQATSKLQSSSEFSSIHHNQGETKVACAGCNASHVKEGWSLIFRNSADGLLLAVQEHQRVSHKVMSSRSPCDTTDTLAVSLVPSRHCCSPLLHLHSEHRNTQKHPESFCIDGHQSFLILPHSFESF